MVFKVFKRCAFWRTRNKRRHLTCHRFSSLKDEDLTIAGMLLSVELIVGLGGLRFSKIEEGQGCGFDGTLRLSTLTMEVIFLSETFSVFVDFHFVLVCLCIGVITAYHIHI